MLSMQRLIKNFFKNSGFPPSEVVQTSSVKKQALSSDLFSERQLMQSDPNTPKSLPCVQTPN